MKKSIIAILIGLTMISNGADHVIAKTLWAEARSEGKSGIIAVASVIYNRGNGDYDKCIKVCLKPKQFSCWNNVTDINVPKPKKSNIWNDASAYDFCLAVEKWIKLGQFIPNGNWTHYAVNNCKAKWFKQMKNTTTIGKHTFGRIYQHKKG